MLNHGKEVRRELNQACDEGLAAAEVTLGIKHWKQAAM